MTDDLEDRLTRLESLLRRILDATQHRLPDQEWFSIEEVAVITGLSNDHVRRHVRTGLLPVVNQGTFEKPYYRIHRKDIDAWMDKRREAPSPAPRKKPGPYVSRHHKTR